ncbi:glucosamine-6-phosphate deaminase [Capnocytophaga canimorsus]|uniref:glucosamine-6-phosphate deaminase n=1 Tax=Capnocytophaga canimorsus TaxID=28188 RepID=UPI001EE02EE4|nr:glucosamine-6-phosphate deaminase [Capnocytophaga canimorsus]GJQ04623.1 glucosamine-6-phosphate deaminase [Capnocytophaga canimorsus]
MSNIDKNKLQSIDYQRAGLFEETRYEKIHNVIFSDSQSASEAVAREIADLIKSKQAQGKHCVLGLATGSSPVKVYKELIRLHKEEGLSFKNVITFNLDEYYPMEKQDKQSYWQFMHKNLFDHVDIDPKNIHIPSGTVQAEEVREYCTEYEKAIEQAGGIDFQLLGIGRTGHIGFNEPGSHINSATRMVTLNKVTKTDAAETFGGYKNVPSKAITMGVGTVMAARRIVLLAWGEPKASIIAKTIEGEISSQIPATFLQEHPNTTFVIDQTAASELTRNKTPWLVGEYDFKNNQEEIARAVIWLCEKLGKTILGLREEDYLENGLGNLLQEKSAYDLNIDIFNRIQRAITGWPGGKPNADDKYRPEREVPHKKRVIIFSPHPDDDVISMGGTFDRLVEQGHEVHIAYQTSGSTAVADTEALRFVEVAHDMLLGKTDVSHLEEVIKVLRNKKARDKETLDVWKLKGNIRRHECYGATRYYNVPDENLHFLNLPFYETQAVEKQPIGEADIKIIEDLIREVKPHQIYAAGDLADPHGTHKVCLDGIFAALERLKGEDYMKDCWVWLYRGAWHEWDVHEMEMIVPMTRDQVLRKRQAIFFHQSQKDGAMYMGSDMREFWQRAEERNSDTAKRLHKLGLAKYEAMEAFRRYFF